MRSPGSRAAVLVLVCSLVLLAHAPRADAQAPVVLQPVPGPPMSAPVIVVPGRPMAPPPPTVVIEASVPACPPGVPCPPPCPVVGACPPPPCACAVVTLPQDVVVEGSVAVAAPSTVAVAPAPSEPASEPAPSEPASSEPAPGTFGLGYLGTFDGADVLHGGGLRFTGFLDDVWFIEGVIGVRGAATATRDIAEGLFLFGPRVAAPLITPVLRVYASLLTGILIRSIGNMQTWGIWPVQLGGGLEVGGPIDERWSIGAYVDVHAEARVPFEREPAAIGVFYSAGLAFLWF